MTGLRRAIALAAALNASVLVGAAAAQTVIVTKAPPGATVELLLNATTIASVPAGPTGEATLPVNLQDHGGRTEMDARIYFDVCPDVRRVLIVERGLDPPVAGSGCTRRDLISLFLLRQVTTLVVDATESNPDVWLRQGPAPSSWLKEGPEHEGERAGRTWRPASNGMMLFGGGGLGRVSSMSGIACGDVTNCSSTGLQPAFTVGAAYWLNSFLGVQGSYMQPSDQIVNGSGETYRFTSTLDARIVTIAWNVGAVAGPARFYGHVGTNYHKATFSTTQTVDDKTITVGGVSQVVTGGTQTLGFRTDGWGWTFGGGMEFWVKPRFALYAEAGRITLKGSDIDGGEGQLDDRITYVVAGLRFRLLR